MINVSSRRASPLHALLTVLACIAALTLAPSSAALEQGEGVILQGLDSFSRDHISHLCTTLLRQRSEQPVYFVYTEPRAERAEANPLVSAPPEGAVDRSADTAKQVADRYAEVLSKSANRLSAAHFRACHRPRVGPVPRLSVILVSRTDTQRYGVLYHRLGELSDTDVVPLSTDMPRAAVALAMAWRIQLRPDEPPPADPWYIPLRGAIPGAVVLLATSVPFAVAELATRDLARDCRGKTGEECGFSRRQSHIQTLDTTQAVMLVSGGALAVAGGALCSLADICPWPRALWFEDEAPQTESSRWSVSFDTHSITLSGDF